MSEAAHETACPDSVWIRQPRNVEHDQERWQGWHESNYEQATASVNHYCRESRVETTTAGARHRHQVIGTCMEVHVPYSCSCRRTTVGIRTDGVRCTSERVDGMVSMRRPDGERELMERAACASLDRTEIPSLAETACGVRCAPRCTL